MSRLWTLQFLTNHLRPNTEQKQGRTIQKASLLHCKGFFKKLSHTHTQSSPPCLYAKGLHHQRIVIAAEISRLYKIRKVAHFHWENGYVRTTQFICLIIHKEKTFDILHFDWLCKSGKILHTFIADRNNSIIPKISLRIFTLFFPICYITQETIMTYSVSNNILVLNCLCLSRHKTVWFLKCGYKSHFDLN